MRDSTVAKTGRLMQTCEIFIWPPCPLPVRRYRTLFTTCDGQYMDAGAVGHLLKPGHQHLVARPEAVDAVELVLAARARFDRHRRHMRAIGREYRGHFLSRHNR